MRPEQTAGMAVPTDDQELWTALSRLPQDVLAVFGPMVSGLYEHLQAAQLLAENPFRPQHIERRLGLLLRVPPSAKAPLTFAVARRELAWYLKSENTRRVYLGAFDDFARGVGRHPSAERHGPDLLVPLDPEVILAVLATMETHHYGVRGCYKALLEHGQIQKNPFPDARRRR